MCQNEEETTFAGFSQDDFETDDIIMFRPFFIRSIIITSIRFQERNSFFTGFITTFFKIKIILNLLLTKLGYVQSVFNFRKSLIKAVCDAIFYSWVISVTGRVLIPYFCIFM